MILRRLTIIITFLTAWVWSNGQQINAVPDYVFRNQMSVGRNAVTDTAAYFSIGPRYGANKGFMPPIVVDTAIFSSGKRNGLLIFSVQKNKFLYWDSVGVKWAEMAGTGGSAITGSGVVGYMPEFTTTTNLDTTRLYHSAGRFAIGSTTTSNGVFNVYGGPTYLDTTLRVGSVFFVNESNQRVGVNTTTPAVNMDIVGDAQISGLDSSSGRLNVYTGSFSTANAVHRLRVADTSVDVYNLRVLGTSAGVFNTTTIARINNNGTVFFSGNVGIGTTTPTTATERTLNIYGPGNSELHFTNNTAGTGASDGFSMAYSGNDLYFFNIESGFIMFGTSNLEAGRINSGREWILHSSGTDAGNYKLQVEGNIYNTGSITTGAPSGGSIKPWKIGEAATVSPTSPNRTLRVEVDGVVYYIHAKTTND